MKKYIIITILMFTLNITSYAQCASVSSQSSMSDNPTSENLNGLFNFDYKIESIIETEKDGELNRIIADYYVNTSDGSIFIPKEMMDQFPNSHELDEDFTFDGALWFADGKMIYYLNDVSHNQKRAFVAPSHSTGAASNLIVGNIADNMAFISDINELPNYPEMLPDWFWRNGITEGYGNDGVAIEDYQTKMTIYADANPSRIKTTTPIVGFLVGIYKNFRNSSCNRQVVFTKIYPKEGGSIIAALKDIKKEHKTFNGQGYKPMAGLSDLIGTSGDGISNMNTKMADFQSRMTVLANRIARLQEEKEDCLLDEKGGSHYCVDYYNPLIDRATEQAKQLQYELMKSMGVEDMMDKN
ncbi:MAG: hypothetical protein QM499_09540 [Flavobacteriaceae bacterium]